MLFDLWQDILGLLNFSQVGILNILKKKQDKAENSIFGENCNHSLKLMMKKHEPIDLFQEKLNEF